MAETRITEIQRHQGTAAERAAMPTAGLPLGSKFYETDTKLTYTYDLPNDTWVFYAPGSGASSGVAIFATFTDGDTTPSVAGGENYKTANTAPTTITDFNDPAPGGHKILIDFGDTDTTIQASANIRLQGGETSPANDFGPSAIGDTMELVYNGTQWRERNRSLNS